MKGDISFTDAIQKYKDIYMAYRNFSPRTRVEYVNDLTDLDKHLEKQRIRKVIDVQLIHLIHYIAELEHRGFAGSTRKRKVISIRSFFTYLKLEGYVITDIGNRLIPPHVEPSTPRYLSKREVDQLLKVSEANIRDFAIIRVLLQTGIKLSEITNLKLGDLRTIDSLESGLKVFDLMIVKGEGMNRGREVVLEESSSSAIKSYLRVRGKSKSESVFLNKLGEPLGKRGVEKIIYKYLKLAGIENANLNSLRHTFGATQVSRGYKLNKIQRAMGHKDIKTTGKYVHLRG